MAVDALSHFVETLFGYAKHSDKAVRVLKEFLDVSTCGHLPTGFL